MLVNASVPDELREAPLQPSHLTACLNLDQASLGGIWSEAQWQRELEEPERPGIGLFRGEELLALATGWLVVEELHITAVAVAPTSTRGPSSAPRAWTMSSRAPTWWGVTASQQRSGSAPRRASSTSPATSPTACAGTGCRDSAAA